ncbi:hypothetical protein OQA88_7004 [Cercophora sp. LCS_1]
MTRLQVLLTATAALLGTVSAWGFKKPCPLDIDICGWALQANYGYDNEILADATHAANQDAGSGTIIYDSIYNCYPDGEVVWSVWCGGGGLCDKAVTNTAHSLCKGEPVDTGREPPYFPPEGEEEPYQPDEPYYPDEPWYPKKE